jgi:hypothetical protein
VVLLLPIFQVVILSIRSEDKWLPRLLLFSYFAVSIFALVSHIYMNEFWFFWFPSFILVWYLLGRNLSLRQRVVVESV